MKSKPLSLITCALTLACALALCACQTDSTTAQQAQSYYNAKYGIDETVVAEYGIERKIEFGVLGYETGREYEMSDGFCVVYLDEDGLFRDNRQSEQITQDALLFAKRLVLSYKALESAKPQGVWEDSLRAKAQHSKHAGASCWTSLYNGDAESYFRRNRGYLALNAKSTEADVGKGGFQYNSIFKPGQEDKAEQAYAELARYFEFETAEVAFIEKGAAENASSLTLFSPELSGIGHIVQDEADPGQIEFSLWEPDVIKASPSLLLIPLSDDVKITKATLSPIEAKGKWEVVVEMENDTDAYFCIANNTYYELVYDDGENTEIVCESGEKICEQWRSEGTYLLR